MTMPSLCSPVTVVTRTRTGTDVFGNDVFTESTVVVPGVLAPGGSVEQVQGEDVVSDVPRVFLPYGTDVSVIDAVVVDGVRYEVDGEPNVWANPFTGSKPGVEVQVRRVTG